MAVSTVAVPLVTVVVAAKNALPLLQKLLKSFVEISPGDCELLVVDGDSRDGTRAWLEAEFGAPEYPCHDAIRWISQPDHSVGEAWNTAVDMARGSWLVFAGADDGLAGARAWDSTVAVLRSQPLSVAAVALPIVVISGAGRLLATVRPELGRGNGRFMALNTLPHQGVFHRRELWTEFGRFDEKLQVAADYEFLLRVIVAGSRVPIVDLVSPVAMTFGGMSKRQGIRALIEMRSAQVRHGLRMPHVAWLTAFVKTACRNLAAVVLGRSLSGRLSDRIRAACGASVVWTAE